LADFGNESTSAGIQYVEVTDLAEVFQDMMMNIWDAKFKDNLENFNYLIDINSKSFETHIRTYPLIENSFAEAHKNQEIDCKNNLAYNYCSNNVYLKELFEHIKNSLTNLAGDYKQIVFNGLLDEIIRDDFFIGAEFQSTEIDPSEIVSEIKEFLSTDHKFRDFKFFSANKKLLQIDDPDFEAIINFINELKALKDQNKLNYIFDHKKIKAEKTLLINLEIDKIPATNHCTAVTVGFANLKDIEDQEENFQNNLVSDIELVANLTKREINPSSYTSSCISNIGQFANDLKRSKGDLFVSKEINPPKGEADFLEINYIKDDDDDEDYYLPAGSPSSSLLLT